MSLEVKEINTNISTRYQFRPIKLEKELQKLVWWHCMCMLNCFIRVQISVTLWTVCSLSSYILPLFSVLVKNFNNLYATNRGTDNFIGVYSYNGKLALKNTWIWATICNIIFKIWFTITMRSPCTATTEKPVQQWRSSTAKNKWINKIIKKINMLMYGRNQHNIAIILQFKIN